MVLNLRQLEIFSALMTARSITGAAELLHVSQPGISRALKYIEYRLNLTLFERSKSGLIPTPEAKALYKELLPAFQRLENLEDVIERISTRRQKVIQIGTSASLTRWLLPTALTRMGVELDTYFIKIDSLTNEDLATYISQHKGDFALSLYDPGHPLVHAEKCMNASAVCILRNDHPLAKELTIDFKKIANYPLISYHSGTALGNLVEDFYKKESIVYKPRITVKYNHEACALVQQGLGWSIALNIVTAENGYPNMVEIPIEGAPKFEVFVLHNRLVAMTDTERSFLNLMMDTLKGINSDLSV